MPICSGGSDSNGAKWTWGDPESCGAAVFDAARSEIKRRQQSERFQMHVESKPFRLESDSPDREDDQMPETVTFPSLSTLTSSLDSLWNEMSTIQIIAHRPTVKKLSMR